MTTTGRLLTLTAFLVFAAVYRNYAMEPEHVPVREPLAQLPAHIGQWTTYRDDPLTPNILQVVGVDDYVNRLYRRGGDEFLSLYVGYYDSQRSGDTIHSPMNCLPGAGWQPIETGYLDFRVPGRETPVRVKRVVIQKGLDRQLVLYWYQSHGRVVGSEYMSKAYLIYDSVRLHRSDAALVRIVTPLDTASSEQDAQQRATDFAQALFGSIDHYLPL